MRNYSSGAKSLVRSRTCNYEGLYADYYLAVAYTYTGMYEFPVKKFYWALSKGELEFSELPDLNDQHKAFVNAANGYFEGNPKKKLVTVKKDGEEGGEGEPAADKGPEGEGEDGDAAKKPKDANSSDISEEEEIKIPPKDLTELDRLAYVVFAIENDCMLAPVGAFKMTPTHQVRRNEAFKGLSADASASLQNYLHFRNVQTLTFKDQLDQPGAPFNPFFLEPLSDDLPRGQWTVLGASQETSNLVSVRSLLWPGYVFYHKVGTKRFGSLYIGDGLKNDELQFMIQ